MKLAVASGKGGTGKTFFAVNIFYSLISAGKCAILLDCDAEEPNAALFVGGEQAGFDKVCLDIPVIDKEKCLYCSKCSESCYYNAIFIIPTSSIIRVIEELCHGCGVCNYVCDNDAIGKKEKPLGYVVNYVLDNGARLIETRMDVGVYSPVKLIRAGVAAAKGASLVIMDSPPGSSCPFIHTVAGADYVVLVTEPTPFGLSDLRQSISVLRQLNKPFGVVVNKAGIGDSAIYDYLLGEDIALLMEIPFKREIAEYCARGELFAVQDIEFRKQLLAVFGKIYRNYGDRDRKR